MRAIVPRSASDGGPAAARAGVAQNVQHVDVLTTTPARLGLRNRCAMRARIVAIARPLHTCARRSRRCSTSSSPSSCRRAARPAARPAGAPATCCAARCRRALPWLAAAVLRALRAAAAARRARCPARDAPFDAAWSAVAYEGVGARRDARAEVLRGAPARGGHGRADRRERAAGLLPATGRAVRRGARRARRRRRLALVAVPRSPARAAGARGFDPAELLARALARRTGLPLAARAAPRRRRRRASSAPTARPAARPARLGFEARGPAPRDARSSSTTSTRRAPR